MRITVAGGTGFLGEPLVRRLVARGDVAVLSRNPVKVRAGRGVAWDGRTQGPWSAEIAQSDVVINLAGENVGEGRWTEERKKQLTASRLDATHAIIEALRHAPQRERTLINASAVGFYGLREDELLDESATRGPGFLAELVEQWESAAREAESLARLVILRFGVAIATDGGALKKMLLPFRLGIGGRIGSGEQWMSWVDRDDVLRMIEWAIDHQAARGIYNVTAPEPVRNRDFTRALGRALHCPTLVPVPAFALRIAFGQMADEALLGGQRAVPRRAIQESFVFESRTIDESFARQLKKK
jgi:uncharacterized protein (TIGR01777 family)